MRVLFWSELFWSYIGGAELSGTKLISALSRRGYEFVVVTSHRSLNLSDQDHYKALTVFTAVAKRFPQVRLLIAGDGAERTALEQQAAQLGIRQAIDFLGWIAPAAVPSLLNTVSLVLMPSRTEGFPRVALETALMARPIVATRVGGLPEVVVHQQTGLLVEKEDSGGLAEAITFLLERPETAIQMGHTARQRVLEIFSPELGAEAYETLYQQLTRKGPLINRT